MIIIITVALIIISGLFVVVFKNLASPKKIDTVMRYIKAGKNLQAAKIAKQIIQKDPKNYHAHYYLGKAYLQDGRGELALIEYKSVNNSALFDAQLPEIPFRREFAGLLMRYEQKQEALREYLLLTKMDPNNPENFFNAGKLTEQEGRKDAALGFYQKTIALAPKNAKAHACLGNILYMTKQVTEAKKELDTAIRLNPEEYSCYYFLGKLLKDTKDYQGAMKAFEKAQRDSEYKQKALIERSTCYMMGNRLDNAQIDLQRAIELDKENTKSDTLFARYFLAACYEKSRKIDKAIEQWEIIYKKNHSFRDVAAKLSEYKDLQANDGLKDYLTCADNEFVEVCKSIALKGFGLQAQQVDSKKGGCEMLAVDTKDGDWHNVRKQMQIIRFYRDPEPVEDSVVREVLDKAKIANCTKTYIIASGGFTRAAVGFAENRQIELIGKDKLEAILMKTSS